MTMSDPSPLVVDAVLLDMDGTLVDSTSLVYDMWGRFAIEHGHDPDEVVAYAHGTPSIATLRRFLPQGEDIDEWYHRVAEWERGEFGGVSELPGAAAFVGSLPAGKWAIVTSAIADAARARLEGAGFPHIDVLVGADDVEHGKPYPEPFLRAAGQLGVDITRCVIFEDSPPGIEAGVASGAEVVVVGDAQTEHTSGLRRLDHWHRVTVATTALGQIEIGGVPQS